MEEENIAMVGELRESGEMFAKIPADPCISRFHVEMGGGGMPRDALDIKCSVDGLLLLPQMAVLAAASLNYSNQSLINHGGLQTLCFWYLRHTGDTLTARQRTKHGVSDRDKYRHQTRRKEQFMKDM